MHYKKKRLQHLDMDNAAQSIYCLFNEVSERIKK